MRNGTISNLPVEVITGSVGGTRMLDLDADRLNDPAKLLFPYETALGPLNGGLLSRVRVQRLRIVVDNKPYLAGKAFDSLYLFCFMCVHTVLFLSVLPERLIMMPHSANHH